MTNTLSHIRTISAMRHCAMRHCAHSVRVCQFPCSQKCETRIFFTHNMTKTIDSSPKRLTVDRRWIYWLKSQSTWVLDVCPLTNAENIWLESQSTQVPDVCLSNNTETIWLESQSSVLRPTQKLLTHIPAICPSTVATTNDSRPRRLSSYRYRNWNVAICLHHPKLE